MMGTTGFFTRRHPNFTDAEGVDAIRRRDRTMEEWFYHTARRYFDEHFNQVFFDKDRRQEIFQTAFLKLWMEMDNGRIRVVDGRVCRQQAGGEYHPMTCALTTFLMAFARTEFRELVRSTREDNYGELFEDATHADNSAVTFAEEDPEEVKRRIVDECIQGMSPTCIEILTMFYYQGKSLDEIMMIRGERSTSKNGLKTAKNKCMTTLRARVRQRLGELG